MKEKVDCKANYKESVDFFCNTIIYVCSNSVPPGSPMDAFQQGCQKGDGQLPPCLLIFLKHGGRGSRLCSLKLVLQINFFLVILYN